MATRRMIRSAYGQDLGPLSGLTPTWAFFAIDGVATTGPSIAEEPAGSAAYAFTLTASAGQHVTGRIDFGDTAAQRYSADVDEHVDNWTAPATPTNVTDARDAVLTRLGTPAGASVSADIATATGHAPTAAAQATIARKLQTNKLVLGTDGVLRLYDDDGTTVLYTWTLQDSAGAASTGDIYRRIPS